MAENNDELESLLQQLPVLINRNQSYDEVRSRIEAEVSYLIDQDFEKLVQLLYRLDVDEEKLRMGLQVNPTADAGTLIATLLIERIIEATRSKEAFKRPAPEPGEDTW